MTNEARGPATCSFGSSMLSPGKGGNARKKIDHAPALRVPTEFLEQTVANVRPAALKFGSIQGGDFAQFLSKRVLEIFGIKINAVLAQDLVHSTGAGREDRLAGHAELENLGWKTVLQPPNVQPWIDEHVHLLRPGETVGLVLEQAIEAEVRMLRGERLQLAGLPAKAAHVQRAGNLGVQKYARQRQRRRVLRKRTEVTKLNRPGPRRVRRRRIVAEI